jgi:GAF domain-containing protein
MSTDAPDYPLVCLGDVLITAELSRRTLRPPDYAAENRALAALAGEMTANLETILQKLVDTALELCRADSAGISILESGEGSGVFRWHAIAGPFAPNLGSTMACDLSPCGTALNRDTVLLFDRPARHFTELAAAEPEMFESLLVPFHADGRPVGTVWAIAHSRDRKFDAEDARCLESLSRFATAAYQLATSLRAETKARGGLVQHLEQQSRILDTTLSSITDFAYVFNKEGRFVFVNQPLLDL